MRLTKAKGIYDVLAESTRIHGYQEMLNNGKNTPLNGYCGQKNRNLKIGLRYDIRDIPISLYAKF